MKYIENTNGYCDTCGEMYVRGYEDYHKNCVYSEAQPVGLVDKLKILYAYLGKSFSDPLEIPIGICNNVNGKNEKRDGDACFLRIRDQSLLYYKESPHNGDLYDEVEEHLSSGGVRKILEDYYKIVREEALQKAKKEVVEELANKRVDSLFPPVGYL